MQLLRGIQYLHSKAVPARHWVCMNMQHDAAACAPAGNGVLSLCSCCAASTTCTASESCKALGMHYAAVGAPAVNGVLSLERAS
jgi:hypothetical protein